MNCSQCDKSIVDKDGTINAYSILYHWAFCSLDCCKKWFSDFSNTKEYQRVGSLEKLALYYDSRVSLVDIPESCWPYCEVCNGKLTMFKDGWKCGYCMTAENLSLLKTKRRNDMKTFKKLLVSIGLGIPIGAIIGGIVVNLATLFFAGLFIVLCQDTDFAKNFFSNRIEDVLRGFMYIGGCIGPFVAWTFIDSKSKKVKI